MSYFARFIKNHIVHDHEQQIMYHGDWKINSNGKGKRHGKGTLISYCKSVVNCIKEGNWVEDKLQGEGKVIFPINGYVWEGEFDNGLINGKGSCIIPNEYKYEGEFEYGKRHGMGTCTYLDGSKYMGEFRSNKEHGFGIFTSVDGDRYDDEWEKGQLLTRKSIDDSDWLMQEKLELIEIIDN